MTTRDRPQTEETARIRRAAERSRGYRWPLVVMVLVLGVALTLFLSSVLQRAEEERLELEFRRDASDRISAFKVSLVHSLDTLMALDALFRAEPRVGRQAFREFVGEHLLEEPGVAFLGWAPRVTGEERARFEELTRKTMDTNAQIQAAVTRFEVFEVQSGAPQPAPPRSEHFPVLYAEPPGVGQHTLGFDLVSDPVQGEALLRAHATGLQTASGRDLMRPVGPEVYGVVVFSPVYDDAGAADGPRRPVLGYVFGMFEVGRIVERGLEALEPRGIHMTVRDSSADPAESLLYVHRSRFDPDADVSGASMDTPAPNGLELAETVRVADREWVVSCRAASSYTAPRMASTPLLALIGGLLLSAILAVSFAAITNREGQATHYAQNALVAKEALEKEAIERERARETQERILDGLPLNIFLKDSSGRIQFINTAGLEFLGRTREDVVGKTDFDFFPTAEARQLRAIDEEVMNTGEALSFDERVSVDARTVHLLAGKTVIRDADSGEALLLGFSVDVSDLKRAEEALRDSEERFRQLVENMQSSVALLEAVDDGTDFVIRGMNKAAAEGEDVVVEEAVGASFSHVFPDLARAGVVQGLRRVSETGEPRYWPELKRSSATEDRWRDVYAYRLPSKEVVVVGHDISERKRLEADLHHAQKMEAVGRLAGGVAHDFNNLLQVVAGNIDMLLAGGLDGGSARGILEEVALQTERGAQLARRLLMFSRRETVAVEDLDLRGVVEGASSLVRGLVRENIEVRLELGDEALPVRADRGQLEQVVMNLVVNASDAMPEGGELNLRCGSSGREEVFLAVADTGSGLASGLADEIFEPYFTTKSAAEGTGLGLAVVDSIVSIHGGRIEVDNRPGEGVEFGIYLPRRLAGGAEARHVEAAEPAILQRGTDQTILLVEDQALVRATMQTMLSTLGYRVTVAASGAEARRLFAAASFDLLLSDMVLPDASGVELASEFRSAKDGLAVLLVSGYSDESLRRQADTFRFLQKPFQLRQLAEEVAAALADGTSEI